MMIDDDSISSSAIDGSLSSRYFRSDSSNHMQYSVSNITEDDSWLINTLTRSEDEEDDIMNQHEQRVFRNFPPPRIDLVHNRVKSGVKEHWKLSDDADAKGERPPMRMISNQRVPPRMTITTINSDDMNNANAADGGGAAGRGGPRKSYRFSFPDEDGYSENRRTPIRKNSSKSPFGSSDHSSQVPNDPYELKKWYRNLLSGDNIQSEYHGGSKDQQGWSLKSHRNERLANMRRKQPSVDETTDSMSVLDFCANAFFSVTKSASSLEQQFVDHVFPHSKDMCCSSSTSVTKSFLEEEEEYLETLQKLDIVRNYQSLANESSDHFDPTTMSNKNENRGGRRLSQEEMLAVDKLFSSYDDDPEMRQNRKGLFAPLEANKEFLRSSSSDLHKQVQVAIAHVKSTISEAKENFEETASICFDPRQSDDIHQDNLPKKQHITDDTVEPGPIISRERYFYPLQTTHLITEFQNQMKSPKENLEEIEDVRDDSSKPTNEKNIEEPAGIDQVLEIEEAPSSENEDAYISNKALVSRSIGGKSMLPVSISTTKSPRLAIHKKKVSLSKLSSTNRGNWRKKIYS